MRFVYSDLPVRAKTSDFGSLAESVSSGTDLVPYRPIGEIIKETKHLSESQIDEVIARQQERGLRFGEAAVELQLATHDEVMSALFQQFNYACVTSEPKAKHPELVVANRPFGEQAEAFRELRSQLLAGVLLPQGQRRALAIVSPKVGDGKTFIAANLAIAFSQLGANTLLIDLDMRTPRQHVLFDLDCASGISNLLSGRSEPNVIRPVPGLPSLFVLPVGTVPPNPLELVQRASFGMLMRELLTKFDHVIVDTPAMAHGADAWVAAGQCGAVLAVGRDGKSSLRAMQKLVAVLQKSPAKMAGIVINER